jgi:hypothetical protein
MSKQSRAEDWRPSSDEERLKKALGEIERIRAQLGLEQALAEIAASLTTCAKLLARPVDNWRQGRRPR